MRRRDSIATPRGILQGCIWSCGLWGLVFATIGAVWAKQAGDVRYLIVWVLVWIAMSIVNGVYSLHMAKKWGDPDTAAPAQLNPPWENDHAKNGRGNQDRTDL